MFTKRNALIVDMLLILLFTSACGAAATSVPAPRDETGNYPTEAPAYSPEVEAPQYSG